jgi:hypothetical protein
MGLSEAVKFENQKGEPKPKSRRDMMESPHHTLVSASQFAIIWDDCGDGIKSSISV